MRQWPQPSRDSEPEIIPPGAPPRSRTYAWVGADGSRRFYRRIPVRTPGPLALVLLGMAVGAFSLVALVLLLGAVLLWIPLIGILAAIAILSGFLRRPSRSPYR